MRMPTIPARPITAQTIAGPVTRSRSAFRAEARSAPTGIGQGAATADPHPTRIPVDTDRGIRIPNGSPGTFSRIDMTLLYPVAQANPSAATRNTPTLARATGATSTSVEANRVTACLPTGSYALASRHLSGASPDPFAGTARPCPTGASGPASRCGHGYCDEQPPANRLITSRATSSGDRPDERVRACKKCDAAVSEHSSRDATTQVASIVASLSGWNGGGSLITDPYPRQRGVNQLPGRELSEQGLGCRAGERLRHAEPETPTSAVPEHPPECTRGCRRTRRQPSERHRGAGSNRRAAWSDDNPGIPATSTRPDGAAPRRSLRPRTLEVGVVDDRLQHCSSAPREDPRYIGSSHRRHEGNGPSRNFFDRAGGRVPIRRCGARSQFSLGAPVRATTTRAMSSRGTMPPTS
jgi:hypothetical protein